MTLDLIFIGDCTNFARPVGAKDKKPRKRKLPGFGPANALGLGGGLGFAYSGVRDDIIENQANKLIAQSKPGSFSPEGLLKARRVGVRHTVTRGAVGAGLGLASLGAYRMLKNRQKRRRRLS